MTNTPLTVQQTKELAALLLENIKTTAWLVRSHHEVMEELGKVFPGSVSSKLLSDIEQLEASAVLLESVVPILKSKLGLD